jgi:hypothetical protein
MIWEIIGTFLIVRVFFPVCFLSYVDLAGLELVILLPQKSLLLNHVLSIVSRVSLQVFKQKRDIF